MAKFDEMKRSILRGMILPGIAALCMVALILWRAVSLMYGPEGKGWKEVSERLDRLQDSTIVKPHRGNIYSCDGELIVSSVQRHKLMMDFKCESFDNDLFNANIDSLCICVAKLYGNIHEPAYYKSRALDARKKGRRAFVFEAKFVSHSDYKRAKKFPFWREPKKKTGLYVETQIERKKTFGNLASRTIGNFDPQKDKGRNGLEKMYDEYLSGLPGLARKEFHGSGRPTWENDIDPVDGADVYSTLDMRMQDVVTSALRDVMTEAAADSGCAMLMDVHTGEIKAFANLTKWGTSYIDSKNYAVGMNSEPGSVFKLASVIALLEEAKIDTSYKIETGDGFWKEKGMHDHNWKADGSGGFGTISLAHAFHVSSNIGIAKPVNEYFGKKKDKFVDKLYSMKLADRMELDIPNDVRPVIRNFDDPTVKNDGTYLTSMAIGYSVQIPPIYTLTFYNAIANNGKMIKPLFVRSVRREGTVLKTESVEEICPKVCSNKTLGKVRDMLKGVVEQGTGKRAKSDILALAGKSGTARMHYNNASGTAKDYQLSFVGYFPADNPRYTCMVVNWQKADSYYLHGSLTAKAFKTIAERIYAMTPVSCESALCDNGRFAPEIKGGYKADVDYLLNELNVRHKKNKFDDDDWVSTTTNDSVVSMSQMKIGKYTVPKVIGLGAKDALYLLENKGLKVEMHGRGTVVQQSIAPGSTASPGAPIKITLK
ncbi:MAG: transpeptidase family protein [Bacteroidales bacterium]|nr:transpeptidase family protein [Candidatus Scybalocola fimicaballi]